MKSQSSNRSFGLLFFIVFLIIGLWPLKNGDNLNLYFSITSLIFLILGLLNSKLLSPLNKIWIKFGEILGVIIAPIIMALVYFEIFCKQYFTLPLHLQLCTHTTSSTCTCTVP